MEYLIILYTLFTVFTFGFVCAAIYEEGSLTATEASFNIGIGLLAAMIWPIYWGGTLYILIKNKYRI